MLEGKRLLITGVLTKGSIAYSVAERAQQEGAAGRAHRLRPHPPDDRARRGAAARPARRARARREQPRRLRRARRRAEQRWGGLDGALHAIAFAPGDALGGNFMSAPPESAELAFRTSAYSFKALAEAVVPLMDDGGSLVGMDFDASVAWPVYDWMGVAKAALESVSRYLARDLGDAGVRVNLISAGPVETPAAQGIPGFDALAGLWGKQAPLGWDTRRPGAGGGRRALPALGPLARDHRRDPARGRRLPRDGRPAEAVGSAPCCSPSTSATPRPTWACSRATSSSSTGASPPRASRRPTSSPPCSPACSACASWARRRARRDRVLGGARRWRTSTSR